MDGIPWQNLLHVVGAANVVLLAGVLAWSPRLARTRSRWLLAAWLAGLGLLLWIFTAVDAGWLAYGRGLGIFHDTVALLVPALLFDYLRRTISDRSAPRWIYLPAALYPLAMVIGRLPDGLDIDQLVFVQLAYSVASVTLLVRLRGRLAIWPRHLVVLIGGVLALHAAQLLRMMFPDSGWLFDAVPLVGAAYFIGLTWLVVTDPRALRRLTDRPPPARTDLAAARAALDRYMVHEQPHLDPGLSLDVLARATDLSRRRLSELVTDAGGFYEYVNRFRVEAACALLADPKERRTSIEAIALMTGFRSRSTFYEAFRRETGSTPGAWRQSAKT